MKNFKKLSAIFLSVLLLIGAVIVPLTVTTAVAADEVDFTQSLIYGQTATHNNITNQDGIYYGSSDTATMKKSTDGNISTNIEFYGTSQDDKLIWMMNSYAKVDSFELWAHEVTHYDFSFKLYISDNTDDLFTDENLVYTHVREEGNSSGGHYTANVAMPDGSDVYGAVVGMYVYETHATNQGIKIRELALWGTPAEDNVGDFYYSRWAVNRNLANNSAKSLINGKLPYTAYVGTSTSTAGGSEYGATSGQPKFTALTDGNSNGGRTNKTDVTGATYNGASNGWYQFTYQLDSLTKVTGAAIGNGFLGDDRAWDWELYVGSDPASLYSGAPVASGRSYPSVDGVVQDGYMFGMEVLLANNANAVGTYVGFKLIPNNSLGDSCIRIAELQVYGEGNQSGTTERWAKTTDVTTDSLLYNRGLDNAFVDKNIAGGNWTFANTTDTYVYLSNGTRLTDGTTSTAHADVSNGTNGKLIWALEETTDIESFVLYNHSGQYYNAAYEVYASDSLDTLFNLENQIYTFTFKDENGNIDPNKMQYGGKYVEFYGDDIKSANYIAVWLREGLRASKNADGTFNSLDTGFRISEIAFYGTKSENAKKNGKIITYVRTNESNYAQVATKLGEEGFTYENNLLKSSNVTVKNASGTTVNINTDKLTNGVTTSEEFYGSYLNYEFTYFLGGLTTVEGFMHIRNNIGFCEGYQVYVGNSMDSLYTEENLVLDMSDNLHMLPRGRTTAIKFGTPKTGMYLGIKWVNVNSYSEVRIAEIAAWGTTEDLGYDLAPNIGAMANADSAKKNASDVNLLRGLKATTGYYGSTHSSTGLYCIDGITDGVANLHYDFNYSAEANGPGSELLYDLGYVSTINEFALWMTCAGRQYSYEVYMGESYDTMFEAPVAVWDYNIVANSLGQKFTFDEPKQARYIAIRLTDTRVDKDSYRLTEVAAFGTLGGADSEFVEINGAEISSDGKHISYNATYTFPAGIMTESVVDIGTVVYPTTALAGAELTLNTAGASIASAATDEVMDIINAYDAAGYKAVRTNSTFSGADSVGATTKLTARAYITLSNGKTYYSAPYNYSVTQVKRLAAKKYLSIFANDTDYIANKGYNGDIDTVWSDLTAAKAEVSSDKNAMLSASNAWINNVLETYGFEKEWIDNGVATLGDSSRLAAVIRKLMRGENITLVQIGGSITEGYYATDKHGEAELVADYLNAVFPGQVTFKNAGIAATGATLGAYRLEEDVLSADPDLVIVEFAINDARDDVQAMGAYEDIIRRLLGEDIAVIALHNLQYYSNSIFAEGSATSHQNIGFVYGLPQVRAFSAYYGTSVYGQGEGKNYNAGDATHPNDQGHNAVAVLVANLINYVMADIENQPTESYAIPTYAMTTYGGYINDNATIYKSQDIEAGSNPVTITGAAYSATGNQVGHDDIRGNHDYAIYTIESGASATITVSNATDILPLVAATSSGSKAATYVVTDADGNVLSEGTFSAQYTGSLTVENARIIEGTRFYNGEAADITITITAVSGKVQLAGVLACVAK